MSRAGGGYRTLSRIAAVLTILGGLLLTFAVGGEPAAGCAFLRSPQTYEAAQGRERFLQAIDAASVDALFPGDGFFGLPPVELGTRANRAEGGKRIPATLLKAIAWVESTLTMAARSVPFESTGPALVSFDCGHGLMQVTTGMTVPLGEQDRPTERQVSVATHYAYNAGRGAVILADKWNQAPQIRPIAGTTTNSDPGLIENWYFAVWSYNGFTGPASNSSNHPSDPGFGGWPRAAYRCDGTQSRNRYPYQELVWGCLANPPEREGQPLWPALPATLPNLSDPAFFNPLSVANFSFPYSAMDIPTAQPAHADAVPPVAPDYRARVLADPVLSVDSTTVLIRLNGLPTEARGAIQIRNPGTGILSWSAEPSAGWIIVDAPAGVALGADIPCGSRCERTAEIAITVNPVLLPQAATTGTLRISSPNAAQAAIVVRIEVDADFEVGAPGTSRAN